MSTNDHDEGTIIRRRVAGIELPPPPRMTVLWKSKRASDSGGER